MPNGTLRKAGQGQQFCLVPLSSELQYGRVQGRTLLHLPLPALSPGETLLGLRLADPSCRVQAQVAAHQK
jgi:hypothetical protein